MTSLFVKSTITASAILLSGTAVTATDTIADWKDMLRGKIESSNSYPSKALERGLEGVVTVRLTFSKEGAVNGVEFVEKSGYDILDRRAFAAAARLADMPALPEGREEISLIVPVRFTLPANS